MTPPIRVLELRSVRGTGGGPEKTILRGAAHADPARVAVTVCYVRDRRDRDFAIDRRAHELGVDYVEIPERHSFDPSVWGALRRLVRERDIQIVHSHEYKTNLLAWLLARRDGVIPLSTVHGWFGCETARERVYYAVDKRLLSRFPRLIAVSGPIAAELRRTGCRGAITILPNGIDEAAFRRQLGRRDAVRRQLGIRADQFVIGAVGRLERQKRFDLLLEAVAQIRRHHSELAVVVVGDGGLRDELLRVRSRLELDDACIFLGHRPDVADLHNGFDLLVQSSDDEGSPNVVLEAMALETPVVVTNAGGTSDLIVNGVHGRIVPCSDRAALAAAIECAAGDPPSLASMAAAARRRVEREFSFAKRMERVEAIYEELVSVRQGRQAVA
jgi:glycosyltransferase involved in cell wall biosynthesis